LIAMLYITLQIDPALCLIALSIAPLLAIVARYRRRMLRREARAVKKIDSAAVSVVHEILGALRVVKAFGQEDREAARFESRAGESVARNTRLSVLEGMFSILTGLTTAAGTTAVLVVGALHVRDGSMTLGDFLLVIAYLGRIYDPMKTIGKKSASLQGHLAGAERAFAVLDEAAEVEERSDAVHIDRVKGKVDFDQVFFSYPGHQRLVVRDLSFQIPAGGRVAVKGRTGSGKTTIMSLLLRFFDPCEGRVVIDDRDVREYKLADLRNQFAVVLQEPVLFSASLSDNIAYSNPEATDEMIIQAATAAGAHDFISRLPDGYQTQVGDRGMTLSGGERQRISIARAFLRNAPILVLDEPTSALDVKSEQLLGSTIRELKATTTMVIIAHRSATLEACDRVAVMRSGRIDMIGTSAELLSQPSFFSVMSDSAGAHGADSA